MSKGETIKQYQDDPYKNYLQKTKMAESGGDNNAKAKTSSALGSFQFLEGTWKDVVNKYNLGYTLADRTDPEKAEKVMRLFTQDNEKALKPVLGRNLTDGEKYLGHFLGIDGASNMFKASKKDPNMPVSYYISPKTIEANKSVFYNKDGSIKTTQQVYDWADKKMGGKVESYNTTQTTPTTPLIDFEVPQISGNFASVPDSPKEETKKEEKPSEALNQLKEEEFVKQYKSLFTQPQVAQQEQEVNQPIQTADLQGIFNQVSQFVDGDVAQQGKIIKDNNGYWNPNNWGKTVEIDGGDITMKGVNQILEGYSPETRERKLMFPNFDYKFKNATRVIEKELKPNEIEFSKNIKK